VPLTSGLIREVAFLGGAICKGTYLIREVTFFYWGGGFYEGDYLKKEVAFVGGAFYEGGYCTT
jgi:hypothetical protein